VALPDAVLVGCDTGVHHDVGGAEYRHRREETESGLAALGVTSCQELTDSVIESARVDPDVKRRLHHVMAETRRAVEAADAMRRADLGALGRLMSASHRSLGDLHEVSTPMLDAVVSAAEDVPGCFGARMVGAGFGRYRRGARDPRPRRCLPACDGRRLRGVTFQLRPSPGVAVLAPDVVRG